MTRYNDDLMNDANIRQKLKLLDKLCQGDKIKASFILIGGAALILTLAMHNKQVRTTRDIDISRVEVDKENSKLLEYFDLLNINSNADSVLFPPGLEILQDGEYK